MESIIAFAADIKSSVKSKHNKYVSNAVLELSEIVNIMQSGELSRRDLERINIFVKDKLIPLYQNFTDLTLQFASKFLEHIVSRQKADDRQGELAVLFDLIPGSIATGVLDFLEVDKKSSTRILVSRHFYAVMSENYFPGSSTRGSVFGHTKATTLTSVYQLLSDSVVGQPENQSQLRNSTKLGGYRIGLALASLQDFLPVEALLELFANLLPSAKVAGGKEKRAQFIEQVFNSRYFPNYQDLLNLLEGVASDWSVTSQKISDLIALKKPSFPQPFETERITVGRSESYSVERIYVDGSSFLASIDEGDSLGTIQLPYHQIERFSISSSANAKVVVRVVSKIPPIKNQQVMSLPLPQEEGKVCCSWEIKADDAGKMAQALRHRKPGFLVTAQRKMSLAGFGVELPGVHSSHQAQASQPFSPPIQWTDDLKVKEKDISSLWSDINPGDTTSPMLAGSKSSKGRATTPAQPRFGIMSPKHEVPKSGSYDISPTAAFVLDDRIRMSVPHKGRASVGPQDMASSEKSLPELTDPESESEASPSQVVRKVTRKNREALLIKSDTEPEDTSITAPKNGSKRELKDAARSSLAKNPARDKNIAVRIKTSRQTRSATRGLTENSDLSQSPQAVVLGKHKLSGQARDGDDRSGEYVPPAKRPRIKRDLVEHSSILHTEEQTKAVKSRPVRKYRAKGGTTSSSPNIGKAKVDFDKPPNATKTALSRMKGRDGKLSAVKPRPVKLRPFEKKNEEMDIRETIQTDSDRKDQVVGQNVTGGLDDTREAMPEISKKQIDEKTQKVGRRNPQKSRKAPWDDPIFIGQVEMSKKETDTSSMQLSELQDYPVPEFVVQVWETSPPMPAGGRSPTTKKAQDIQMIDPTEADSPLELEPKELAALHVPGIEAPLIPRQLLINAEEQVTRLPRSVKEIKTSVDIGIQANAHELSELQPSTPMTRPATRRRSSKMETASVRLVRRARPLVIERMPVSIATTTSTLLQRNKPNRSPVRIARPSTVRRIHHRSIAPSPKASRLNRQHAPEVVNCRIADVLSEINSVVLDKIGSKFETVRDDLKTAQRRMLVGTKEKLEQMHQLNVDRYNLLVGLYEKYAAERRENMQLFEEMRRSNQEAFDGVTDVILKHSRHSISKKFPKSMFSNVPTAIRNQNQPSV